MQITSCQFTNTKYIQIYLTEYRVAIFVAGKENYPEILEKIITKQKELKRNVC